MVMAVAGDSSGRLPDDSNESIRSRAESDEERRERLLTSAHFRNSIAKVARSRGVPDGDLEDVVHETLLRALGADLPARDEAALQYTNAIAAYVACDHVAELVAEATEPYDEGDEDGHLPTRVSAEPPSFDDREVLRKVIAHGQRRFPKTFPWFLRSRLFDETSDAIASDHQVQASHVRHEISVVNSYVQAIGQKMGLAAALLVFVVVGVLTWLWRPFDQRGWPVYETHRVNPPPLDAARLRERAVRAFNARAWQACIDDLDAADRLDPEGRFFTAQVFDPDNGLVRVELRAAAEGRLHLRYIPPFVRQPK